MATSRQQETAIAERKPRVLEWALQGRTIRDMASELGVSYETVRLDYLAVIAELAEERQALGKAYLDEHLALVKSRLKVTIAQQQKQYSDKTEANIARYLEQLARLLELPGYSGAQPAPTNAMQINITYNAASDSPTADSDNTITITPSRGK